MRTLRLRPPQARARARHGVPVTVGTRAMKRAVGHLDVCRTPAAREAGLVRAAPYVLLWAAAVREKSERKGKVATTPRPTCGARCRSRGGAPCEAPAVWDDASGAPRNGRCRMHGGLSTGPRTPQGRARALDALRRGRARRRRGRHHRAREGAHVTPPPARAEGAPVARGSRSMSLGGKPLTRHEPK